MKRQSAGLPFLLFGALVAMLLLAYVAGYFWLSELATGLGMIEHTVRIYPSRLLAEIYRPAALVESAATRSKVITAPQSGPLLGRG